MRRPGIIGACGLVGLFALLMVQPWMCQRTLAGEPATPKAEQPPAGLEQAGELAAQVEAASAAELSTWVVAQGLDPDLSAQDVLVYACAMGAAPIARYLLNSGGATPDAASAAFAATPLHSAVYNGNLHCVAVLLAAGADFNLNVGGDMGTPLHQAAMGNRPDCAALLLACGAKLEERNELGVTPLHDAANSNAAEVAALLLEAGAQVDAKTVLEGNTALLLAANRHNLEVGRLLLEAGAAVDFAEPSYRLTGLHLAALSGDTAFVQLLLKFGADRGLKSSEGATAYDYAMAGGFAELAGQLR